MAGGKISEQTEIIDATGQEFLLLAVDGENYKVKIQDIVDMATSYTMSKVEPKYVEITSEEAALGVSLEDNYIYSVYGAATNFLANSSSGYGIINFVAGSSTSFTLPSGDSWDGGVTPTFFEGRIYTVTYTEFRTWYADSGH